MLLPNGIPVVCSGEGREGQADRTNIKYKLPANGPTKENIQLNNQTAEFHPVLSRSSASGKS